MGVDYAAIRRWRAIHGMRFLELAMLVEGVPQLALRTPESVVAH
jgi:hypothetical protein